MSKNYLCRRCLGRVPVLADAGQKDRLVYEVISENILISQCKGHYADK